jgi:hypothetical protein
MGCEMAAKTNGRLNHYRCNMEKNQGGKYCVRVRARFARRGWELAIYFLAATRGHALRKLEQSLRFLQENEERLWFWGVDRSDDPNFAAELLDEEALKLDRRAEFPHKVSEILLAPDGPMAAILLAPVRRDLASARESLRVASD